MSSSPAQGENGPVEQPPVVFQRLTDVPLDSLEKLIHSTEHVYDDLNKVHGHEYWADLVLHQGAAIAALREAWHSLDALRGVAVGARNSELGVTVATGVIDGDRHYAHTDQDKKTLVERLLRPETIGRACHLFVWDRPYEDDDTPGPFERLRIVTDPGSELGVLNYTQETDDGELRSWHTFNPDPLADSPVLRFDSGSALRFPQDAVLRFADLRSALDEFTRGGNQPGAVRWQPARWGE